MDTENGFIQELVFNFINPKAKEQKKLSLKQELMNKFNKSLYLKDYLKSKAWLEFDRPIIYKSLESGIGRLLRDGLVMNELDIKSVLSDMRANLNKIAEMQYAIENGEEAGMKLEKMK